MGRKLTAKKSAAKPVKNPRDSLGAVVPARLGPGDIPNCETVCKHIMGLALAVVPEDEREAVREAGYEVIKECVPECKKDLDDEAKACFVRATNMSDGDACDKALTERRKKLEKREERPKKVRP